MAFKSYKHTDKLAIVSYRRILWKRELINQIKEAEAKFMALEKEWLQRTAEKF